MARRSSTAAEAQVAVLILVLAAAALVYGPRGGMDGIVVSKATVAMFAALVCLAAAAAAAVHAAKVRVPRHAVTVAAAALAVTMIVRVLVASEPSRAIVGAFGRWNGLALYLAGLVLFVTAASRLADRHQGVFLRGLLVAGLAVALFAVDDAFLGLGPTWGERPAPAGTLGNPNFLAAWAAAVVPAAVVVLADRAQHRAWRVAAAAGTVLLLVSVVVARSYQGFYVLAAGLAVLGLAWATARLPGRSRVVLLAAAALAAIGGAAMTVLGALGRGPAAFLGDSIGVQLRAEYWAAAGRMIADRPLLGVGPGQFAQELRVYRSPEAATLVPLESTTDAAHNVPLHLFAEWGVFVGVVYVALVVLVTTAMVRELAERRGPARMRYAGLAAVWVGYLLQSLISIDSPALVVLGWVVAGAVVAPRVTEWWTRELPWRATGRSRRHGAPTAARIAHAGVAVTSLLLAWAVLLPWRADAASAGGEVRAQPGESPPVVTRAMELAPWESEYALQAITVLGEQDQGELLWELVDDAHASFPERFVITTNAARVETVHGDVDGARERYERALEQEPHHPDFAVEVAEFALEHADDPAWARELLDRALDLAPEHEAARELEERL